TERDVDGQAREEDFERLGEDFWDIRWYRRNAWDAIDRAVESCWCNVWDSQDLHEVGEEEQRGAREKVETELAVVLREIVGNPFCIPTVDPDWPTWSGGAVRKLAQAIYDGRSFEELPILADALEEAGCTDPDILSHLRGPGPHVRGCWVVDLVLGKE